MTQVSGRAGREEKSGQVILQTYCPDHPQIEEIINGTYQSFAQRLLDEEELPKTPPYFFQVKVYAESPKSIVSRDFIRSLIKRISIDNSISKDLRIVGPLPSLMKKSGVYRWELNIFSKIDRNYISI